jgi:hypothetical protein
MAPRNRLPRVLWWLVLPALLTAGATEVQAQAPLVMRSRPADDPQPAPAMEERPAHRSKSPGMGLGSIGTLLPLLLMAAMGVGLFFFVRWLANKSHSAPPGYPPGDVRAQQRAIEPYYHQATVQLGSEDLDSRVAAINTLGRLAWDNPWLHQRVCATLDGFLRAGLATLPGNTAPDALPADLHTAQSILAAMTGQPPPPGGRADPPA